MAAQARRGAPEASAPLRLTQRRALLAIVALAGLGWAALLASGHLAGRATPLDRLEYASLDARTVLFGPQPSPGNVVIVAIDDATVAQEGRYPVSRTTVARIVSAIAAAGARAIALDMLFVTPSEPEADRALAAALRDSRAVVAAAATFGPSDDETIAGADLALVPAGTALLGPIEPVAAAAGRGVVNLATDGGGTPRFAPLLVRVGTAVEPALALSAAALGARAAPVFAPDAVSIGSNRIPLDLGRHLPLAFRGPAGTIRTVSAAGVLAGAGATLRDKIVLVGVTATGAGDTFATPFDPVLPGVEVIGTAVAQLGGAGGLVRTEAIRRIDAALALALTAGIVLALALPRLGIGLALAAALLATWLAAVLVAFGSGLWLSVAVPLASALPSATLFLLCRSAADRRSAATLARTELALRPFQQPALAARLAREPDFLASAEEREIAIVFIDLTGFTGLSEAAGPKATRDLLATFHALVEEETERHGGIVASYQGDGAMILFGLLATSPDDAALALAAAKGLAVAVGAWIDGLPRTIGPLGVKLGAHCGPASLSRLGHRQHQHITAIGDAVNVASRLMGVAAGEAALLAASAAIVARAREPSRGKPISAPIRGRSLPLDVFIWRPEDGFVGAQPNDLPLDAEAASRDPIGR